MRGGSWRAPRRNPGRKQTVTTRVAEKAVLLRLGVPLGKDKKRALVGGAVVNGFFGEEGLLADAVGDFGEFALVGADGGEVVGLADEVEGAEGFPDLFIAGSDGGDFGAGGYARARSYRESSNASGDGGAKFGGLLAILKFCDQAALVDGGSNSVGVSDAAGGGSDDAGGL